MASSCTYYEPNCGSTRLCDQNCGCMAADRHTHTHTRTQGQTKVKILRDLRSCQIISFTLGLWSLAVQKYCLKRRKTGRVWNCQKWCNNIIFEWPQMYFYCVMFKLYIVEITRNASLQDVWCANNVDNYVNSGLHQPIISEIHRTALQIFVSVFAS